MAGASTIRIPALSATVLVTAALYFGRSIFAPLAVALFIMAVVWPIQETLQKRIPKGLALLVTILVTVAVMIAFGSLIAWGLGEVGSWFMANTARFQSLFAQTTIWLEQHDIFIADSLSDKFNAASLMQYASYVADVVNSLLGFSLIVLIYMMLGLPEVDDFRQHIKNFDNRTAASDFLQAGQGGTNFLQAIETISEKARTYMVVRTLASILTGIAVWAFLWIEGVNLAPQWGVIAFALNFIPYIGTLVATVLPTILASAQFESVQMGAYVFVGLIFVQSVIGSYIEPTFSGAKLAISPFVSVVTLFMWSFLWGLPGALIGVPLTLAVIALCELNPSTRWIATMLSGPPKNTLAAQDVAHSVEKEAMKKMSDAR
jgi:predicted PurR-regulated permease PerM